MPQPPKTREYRYLVGRVPITALLTEEQAARLKAELVEPDPEPQTPEPDATDKARRTTRRRG